MGKGKEVTGKMAYRNFGEFLYAKRMEKKITLRGLADMLGCTAVYVSDVEKDRRNPFDRERLAKLAEKLELTAAERDEMYDLVGKKRDTVAPDIEDYIRDNEFIGTALRTCRDMNLGEEDWERMVAELKARRAGYNK